MSNGTHSLTDSHAHLTSPELRAELPAVLARARLAGVTRVMTVSAQRGDAPEVVALAAEQEGVWAAIGVHPHEAAAFEDDDLRQLRDLAAHPRVLAIGEIGLDYHHDLSPRDAQREAFRRQLVLARECRLPVVIHSRAAEEDTAAILRDEGAADLGGVLHCFTSRWDLAETCLEMGLLVSLSGIVTFRNAEDLREAARRVPADRLLVETDSPYLAPVPHRGRTNEPALVRTVAEFVAGLRGVPLEELALTTSANFDRTFRPDDAAAPSTAGRGRPAS